MNKKINLIIEQCDKITGISNYSLALADEFSKMTFFEKTVIKTYVPAVLNKLFRLLTGINIQAAFKSYPLYVALEKNSINHLTSQQQAICLNYLKQKTIVTVHDLIPFSTNTFNSYLAKKLYWLAMRGLKKASLIIADSEHTKKDIISFLHYPEDKIKVIPLGVDHDYFKPAKIKRDELTILYVGSEMPHKNVIILFKAFVFVKKKIHNAKLVKVGLSQWSGARDELLKFVKENNLESSVIFKDYVENLAEEYQRATVFVFPSKYEGFGFPPLEAMACGCPVICSNVTSLPEVVGDSAILFNPDNVQELAEKMLTLLNTPSLQKKYSIKGIKKSKEFTWEKCAKKTIEIYSLISKI